jgi:lysophospholipid acyltransferase (LPLAT)-like uncharacterized protein
MQASIEQMPPDRTERADRNAAALARADARADLSAYTFKQRLIIRAADLAFYLLIQRFGYGASRGSSSRGGVGALVEMVRLMRAGRPTAFTIDGPRGPRHEAKMGALLLAKKTGCPVLPFTVNAAHFYAAPSWDRFQVPLPFTRAHVRIAPPIYVPADADEAALNAKRDELQRALDGLSQ